MNIFLVLLDEAHDLWMSLRKAANNYNRLLIIDPVHMDRLDELTERAWKRIMRRYKNRDKWKYGGLNGQRATG